jgi:hypothetical protein
MMFLKRGYAPEASSIFRSKTKNCNWVGKQYLHELPTEYHIIPFKLINLKPWRQEKVTFRNSYRRIMQVEEGKTNNEQIKLIHHSSI